MQYRLGQTDTREKFAGMNVWAEIIRGKIGKTIELLKYSEFVDDFMLVRGKLNGIMLVLSRFRYSILSN